MKNNVGNDNDSTMEALLSDAKLSYLCPNVLKHKQPTGGRNVPDKARLLSGQEITRIINYKNHNNKFPQIDPINASYIAIIKNKISNIVMMLMVYLIEEALTLMV